MARGHHPRPDAAPPPRARMEAIFGLLPHHTGKDILLAAYQGIAFSIRDCYDSLNKKIKKLLLSGGGSGSRILPQIIADTLNTNVSIPSGEEFGAKGVAYLCSVALKKEKNLQSIVKKSETCKLPW